MSAPSRPAVRVPADYLTYEEAAKTLGIHPASLRTAIAKGKLHPIKVQGLLRKFLSRTEVESYHERKGSRGFEREAAPENSIETPELAQLREVMNAVSGPIIEVFDGAQASARDAQATARHALSSLAHVAAAVLSATGGVADPKHLAG